MTTCVRLYEKDETSDVFCFIVLHNLIVLIGNLFQNGINDMSKNDWHGKQQCLQQQRKYGRAWT